jgi:YidC/Oxa1 family membrane protein insertase
MLKLSPKLSMLRSLSKRQLPLSASSHISTRLFSNSSPTPPIDPSLPSALPNISSPPTPTPSVDVITQATTATDSSSFIPPDYHPFHLLSELIETVHSTLDIPYWGSIVLCTVTVRVLLFPTALLQFRNSKRAMVAGEKVKEINQRYGNVMQMEPSKRAGYQEEVATVYHETGFIPSRTLLLGLFPAPIFISFFFGLQKMAETNPEFLHGGALFFENLTIPDPYYVLPAINTLLFLAIGESNQELKKNPQMLAGMRALSLVIGGVATQFPAVSLRVHPFLSHINSPFPSPGHRGLLVCQ